MKYIGRFLGWILLGINLCMVVLLLVCAYSPYIDPVAHPVWSCAGLAFPAFLIVNLLFLVFWLVIYRKYALLSFLGLVCSIGAIRTYFPVNVFVSDVPEGAIKFLSYNTMAFEKNRANTKDNPNPVLEYLRNSNADIICLQEYIVGGRLTKKEVDYALRDYPYKNYYKISGANGLGCYSRFPILSAHPVRYASLNNGSIAYKIKVNGDTLLVVNNHLESNKLTEKDKEVYREMMKDPDKQKVSQGSRLLIGKLAEASAIRAVQADSIARLVAGYKGGGIIVCGDFNDPPGTFTYETLKSGLKDGFQTAGEGYGATYRGFHHLLRIDYLFHSTLLEGIKYKVIPYDMSDHNPVYLEVGL
jgi:endonuclease/exonuclease/phosphatase family metal-dependent hydrolase